MIVSNPSSLVNNLRQTTKSRVTISQLTWFGSISVACIVGVVLGAPVYLALASIFVALVPIGGWALGRSGLALSEQAQGNITIFCWLVVTFAALAIGGGVLSPLMIVLLLGPFSALAQGRHIVAIEVLVIGGLAFAASLSAGAMGWSETVPASWSVLIGPLAVATLFQLGAMFWVCAVVNRSSIGAANDLGASKDGDTRLSDILDLNLPVLLIRTSREGRIRMVYGPKELRWPALGVGRELGVLNTVADGETISAPNGDRLRVLSTRNAGGGGWIGLLPETSLVGLGNRESLQSAEARIAAAETALGERTAFFAGLGHDLKTPLNAIIGFSDLMKAEVYGALPERYKDYPGLIHESGQDLMLLVDDILDLAKSEAKAQRLEPEPVDLAASGQSVAQQLQDQARRAGVDLKGPDGGPVWAEADARAVRQIWQNLVSNAIKYSKPDGTVVLAAHSLGSAVTISVSDDGAGMDQADLDRIAKPFAQGSNSKGRAGTGLGLAVVHRFAQLHGGKVIIDTQEGKGTRVRVTLPSLDPQKKAMTKDIAK